MKATTMKALSKNVFYFSVLLFSLMVVVSCNNDDDTEEGTDNSFVGEDGNPRFNLQFTNEENVDLDLYVRTPNGTTIFYANRTAEGGELDVDCQCSSCPQGANENIFWENGTAPTGTFEYWVEYFGACGSSSSATSNFTLRVIRNGQVLTTRTGSLSSPGQSQVWTHNQE